MFYTLYLGDGETSLRRHLAAVVACQKEGGGATASDVDGESDGDGDQVESGWTADLRGELQRILLGAWSPPGAL